MDEKTAKDIIPLIPIHTICVLVLCIALSKVNALASLFVYDREAIFRGELWRLVTSHFVHFSDLHLIYNIFVFGIVGWIVEYKGFKFFKLLWVLMACSISATLLLIKPDMIYFGGLSGMACGYILYCSLLCLREPSPWRNISIFAIILLFVKIILETYNKGSVLPYLGVQTFIPMPLSHTVGSLTALIIFLFTQNIILKQNILSSERNRVLTSWWRKTLKS
jgi:rhomboid family GlyGly-CTERM serine protease